MKWFGLKGYLRGGLKTPCNPFYLVGVHGFTCLPRWGGRQEGSGVQGSILVPGLHLGGVFTRKASASSGLIRNLEPNWQLFGKTSIVNEDFGSLMPSLSLTLNVEL